MLFLQLASQHVNEAAHRITAGTSRDVRTVIIDGRSFVDGGRVAGVGQEHVRSDAERVGGRLRATLASRDWGGRTEDEIFAAAFKSGSVTQWRGNE